MDGGGGAAEGRGAGECERRWRIRGRWAEEADYGGQERSRGGRSVQYSALEYSTVQYSTVRYSSD